jgi:hypothetical protein
LSGHLSCHDFHIIASCYPVVLTLYVVNLLNWYYCYYRPYPPQAAAILEDAYQYLKWYLAATDEQQQQQQQSAAAAAAAVAATATGTTTDDQSAKAAAAAQQQQQPAVSRPTVWLTVQVVDQLVQFRSLTDIVSITRTLGGAVSVLGRRAVHRGLPAQQSNAQTATAAATTTASSSTDTTATTAAAAATATASTPTKASVTATAAAATTSTGSCGNGDVQAAKPDVDADLNEHVSHLILVVHGIGDALSTMDLGVVQLRSLVDCCNNMRAQHAEVVEASPHLHALKHHHRNSNNNNSNGNSGSDSTTASATKKAATAAQSKTAVDGRVEYLPIEWHSRFKTKLHAEGKCGRDGTSNNSSGVSDEQLSIWDITLKRAATLRAYTNDTVLDVLYFMSPEYHQIIVQEVTAEVSYNHY